LTVFSGVIKDGALKGLRTARMLLTIMIPIYLGVVLVQHTSLYYWFAEMTLPVMRIFGLPGDAVLPVITGFFADEYAVVAALSGFSFSKAEVTVIAMIILCLHGVPVETVITKKIGMPAGRIVLFRLGLAAMTGILAGWLASVFLGGNAPEFSLSDGAGGRSAAPGFVSYNGTVFDVGWDRILPEMGLGTLTMAFNVLRIIIPLMIGIELMLVYHIVEKLAKKLKLFCRLLDIAEEALLPLLVGLLLGVTYGAGVLAELNRTRQLDKRNMALLGVFLFSCHGVLEMTYLFAVANASIAFVSGLRLGIAIAVTAIAARTVFRKKPQDDANENAE